MFPYVFMICYNMLNYGIKCYKLLSGLVYGVICDMCLGSMTSSPGMLHHRLPVLLLSICDLLDGTAPEDSDT